MPLTKDEKAGLLTAVWHLMQSTHQTSMGVHHLALAQLYRDFDEDEDKVTAAYEEMRAALDRSQEEAVLAHKAIGRAIGFDE